MAINATRVDDDTFTVTGDQTSAFHTGRRVKLEGDSTAYGTILSSSYSTNTTVNLTSGSDTVPTGTLTVLYGIVSSTEASTSMPIHDHEGEGSGGNITASAVTVADADGLINSTNVEDTLTELAEKTNKNGFDRYDTDSMPTVTYDYSTRTLSVAVKSGQSSFHFWVNNKKITKTTTQSKQHPDTSNSYYFYFDNNGTLQVIDQDSVSGSAFYSYAVVAFVYYNASYPSEYLLNADEMHGKDMAGITHESIHDTVGARYSSGLGIEGLVAGNDTYTQSASGKIYDEDIPHSIAANSSGHKFLYRYGADGDWRTTSASLNCSYNAGGSYDVWNEWTGSTWQLTEGTSSTDYWIIFYIASPQGIFKVIGQNAYSSVRNARNAIESEIYNIKIDGLPNPEFVWLGATIVKRDGNLQEMADGSVFYYLTQLRGGGGGSNVTTYADDVPTSVTNFDGILSSADTSVQLALDTIDDHEHDVVDDTTPQLGGNLDWNSNGIMLVGQTVGGSDGDLVYLSSANTWSQADADAESTCSGMLGIRISSTTVLTHGVYTTSGLTAGSKYYASTTAGGITTTAPSAAGDIVRVVGYALSTTEFFFDPDKSYVEIGS